jgi:hypothetical protein
LPIFFEHLRTLDNRVLNYDDAEAEIKGIGNRGGTVKHFSITEWADYARDVTTEEQSTQMQRHLDEGCSDCTEMVQTWKSVRACARQEVSYEPPSSSLRIATSYFAPFKLASKQTMGMRIGRLTFDSFTRRAEVGVRGSDPLPRQLMYQFDDVFIDLRLEPKPATNQVGLVGQVADARETAMSVDGMPISLLRGSETLSKTSTNKSGEFRLSFLDSEHLQLLIGLKETVVVLPLPDAKSGTLVH